MCVCVLMYTSHSISHLPFSSQMSYRHQDLVPTSDFGLKSKLRLTSFPEIRARVLRKIIHSVLRVGSEPEEKMDFFFQSSFFFS